METVRTVVNLGRGLRKREDLRVRQPLSSVTVVSRSDTERAAVVAHADLIAEELNVKSVEAHADEAGLVDLSAKGNFKTLGPRYGKETKSVAAAIDALDHSEIVAILDGRTVHRDGYEIATEDLVVERIPRSGTVVATEGSLSVALDCAITEDLASEGLAREIVNRIQGIRRDMDLDVTDRINVKISTASEALRSAAQAHEDIIAGEVLADSIEFTDESDGVAHEINGETIVVAIGT